MPFSCVSVLYSSVAWANSYYKHECVKQESLYGGAVLHVTSGGTSYLLGRPGQFFWVLCFQKLGQEQLSSVGKVTYRKFHKLHLLDQWWPSKFKQKHTSRMQRWAMLSCQCYTVFWSIWKSLPFQCTSNCWPWSFLSVTTDGNKKAKLIYPGRSYYITFMLLFSYFGLLSGTWLAHQATKKVALCILSKYSCLHTHTLNTPIIFVTFLSLLNMCDYKLYYKLYPPPWPFETSVLETDPFKDTFLFITV